MLWLLKQTYPHAEIVVVIANTGLEHPATWRFVKRVAEFLGIKLVIVEAVINPEMNEGTTHKIVTFDTLAMSGEPFEEMIKKYGIPNQDWPHCTRELKENPMYSYIHNELGWKRGEYMVAIGIRADEPGRISDTAKERHLIYPLADAGYDKIDVIQTVRSWGFDLEIEEFEGNCVTCWKKSDTKHIANIKKNRDSYAFFDRMDRMYATHRGDLRRFFRGHRTTAQMLALADLIPEQLNFAGILNREDESGGCAEECIPVFS
jgi:hypothetical protein